jgi:hypothetical protein
MVPDARIRQNLVRASVILWFISLVLPAAQFRAPDGSIIYHWGIGMFLNAGFFGWFRFNFAFLANPLLFFGLKYIRQQRYFRAICCLASAALLTLETFQLLHGNFYEMTEGVEMVKWLEEISHMLHPTIGWYVWVTSIVVPLVAAIRWYSAEKALIVITPEYLQLQTVNRGIYFRKTLLWVRLLVEGGIGAILLLMGVGVMVSHPLALGTRGGIATNLILIGIGIGGGALLLFDASRVRKMIFAIKIVQS